jgi:stage III sporulation protein AE
MWMAAVLVFLFLGAVQPVQAASADDFLQDMLDELDLEELDEQTDGLQDKLQFSDLVQAILADGTDGIDGAQIRQYLYDLFFYEFAAVKPLFLELVCTALLFSLFGKALAVRQGYVSEMGFFVVYTGILLLLLESFSVIGEVVEDGVSGIVSFMTAFIPTYAATLLVTGNTASAGVFYELAFGLIYLLELGMKILFVPGIHLFVLLQLVDNLFEETRFSKLAGLLEDGIVLVLRLGIGVVAGLGVVQSLIAPARDRLAADGIYRGLSALPGVGSTFSAAGELLVGCGILIKNSIGVAALLVLTVICLIPLFKVFCYHVMYRLAAALLEPFCDRRIAQCVQDVGRGCAIYLRLLRDVLLLLWITVSLIGASTSFIY